MSIIAMLGPRCGRISFDTVASTVTSDGPVVIDGPFTPPPPASQADCPATYTFNLSSCYAYQAILTVDWLTAERTCESVGADQQHVHRGQLMGTVYTSETNDRELADLTRTCGDGLHK